MAPRHRPPPAGLYHSKRTTAARIPEATKISSSSADWRWRWPTAARTGNTHKVPPAIPASSSSGARRTHISCSRLAKASRTRESCSREHRGTSGGAATGAPETHERPRAGARNCRTSRPEAGSRSRKSCSNTRVDRIPSSRLCTRAVCCTIAARKVSALAGDSSTATTASTIAPGCSTFSSMTAPSFSSSARPSLAKRTLAPLLIPKPPGDTSPPLGRDVELGGGRGSPILGTAMSITALSTTPTVSDENESTWDPSPSAAAAVSDCRWCSSQRCTSRCRSQTRRSSTEGRKSLSAWMNPAGPDSPLKATSLSAVAIASSSRPAWRIAAARKALSACAAPGCDGGGPSRIASSSIAGAEPASPLTSSRRKPSW
mmetsp:Transcript_61015/g.193530  ORF Transcript_61015/g.193530 Transcript_61015/m.193530 type:complete len:373 (+) Transcript_61015:41-1159(+)